MDLKSKPPVSLITNYVKVKSDNTTLSTDSTSIYLIHPVWLLLTQYVYSSCNNLCYIIYILNTIEYDIYNVNLIDILPKGINFISTYVESGTYRYFEDIIIYEIPIIKPNSFCKITINVHPVTLGKKINSIEVIGKKSKHTIHNPSKSCVFVN